MKPSQRYLDLIEVNKEEHRRDPDAFGGQSLINLICPIGTIIQEQGCRTVLDYGAGKGRIQDYFHVGDLWGVHYVPYDPTVPGRDVLPAGKYDAVIATDVLEHIPEEDLVGWVVDEIFGKANKIVFVKVPTYLADRILSNGENCHCTIKPKEWWEDLLTRAAKRHKVGVGIWIKVQKNEGAANGE